MAPVAESVAVRIFLPIDLLNHFEALASIEGVDVEQVIVGHLARTKMLTAENGLNFDDERAGELRKLLGTAVTTPDKVIEMVRRLLSHRLSKYKVTMSAQREEALFWWLRNSGMPEDKALEMFWDQCLGKMLQC